MAVTVQDICTWMEEWADPALAEPGDNPGLQIGRRNQAVRRVLTALDATETVIEEAAEKGCEMIVTHHPLLYRPVSHIDDGQRQGRRLLMLAEKGIALYSAHTNLDLAAGGTNDLLAQRLELVNCLSMPDEEGRPFLQIGELPEPMPLRSWAEWVKERLELSFLRMTAEDPERIIRRAALCTGAGGSLMGLVLGKADVYITGDVSYHRAEDAAAEGLAVLDAGHFGTEVWMAQAAADYLNSRSREIRAEASERMKDVFVLV